MTAEEREQVRAVIREAKTLLLNVGWRQRWFYFERDGVPAGYCLTGALRTAAGMQFSPDGYKRGNAWVGDVGRGVFWLWQYTDRLVTAKNNLGAIPIWNDVPGRTLEDVLAVLDNTLLALDEEENDANDAVAIPDSQERPLVGAGA